MTSDPQLGISELYACVNAGKAAARSCFGDNQQAQRSEITFATKKQDKNTPSVNRVDGSGAGRVVSRLHYGKKAFKMDLKGFEQLDTDGKALVTTFFSINSRMYHTGTLDATKQWPEGI